MIMKKPITYPLIFFLIALFAVVLTGAKKTYSQQPIVWDFTVGREAETCNTNPGAVTLSWNNYQEFCRSERDPETGRTVTTCFANVYDIYISTGNNPETLIQSATPILVNGKRQMYLQGLAPGASYVFRVKAYKQGNLVDTFGPVSQFASKRSPACSFSVSCAANPNPVRLGVNTTLTATAIGGNSPAFNWQQCNFDSGSCGNSLGTARQLTQSFGVTGYKPFKVTAVSGPSSAIAYCPVIVADTPIVTFNNLRAADVPCGVNEVRIGGKVALSWTTAINFSVYTPNYKIYRNNALVATVSSGFLFPPSTTAGILYDYPSFIDSVPSLNTIYDYHIVGSNSVGDSTPPYQHVQFSPRTSCQSLPTVSCTVDGAPRTIFPYYSDNYPPTADPLPPASEIATWRATVQGVGPFTYSWTGTDELEDGRAQPNSASNPIAASYSELGEKQASVSVGWSGGTLPPQVCTQSVVVEAEPSSNFTAEVGTCADGTADEVTIEWTEPVSDAVMAYEIYRDGNPDPIETSFDVAGRQNARSSTDSGLTPGSSYSYFMKTVYIGGSSDSATISVGPIDDCAGDFDYHIEKPADQRITEGEQAPSISVSVKKDSGTAEEVSLSSNLDGSFSQDSCDPDCSAMLDIDTTALTVGEYTVTITGDTAGGIQRITNFKITVSSLPELTVSCSGSGARVNEAVTWTAIALRGSNPVSGDSYEWVFNPKPNQILTDSPAVLSRRRVKYASVGIKNTQVTVTQNGGMAVGACSVEVRAPGNIIEVNPGGF